MKSRTWKVLLSGAVVAGGLGYLLYSTGAEGLEYYKHVDEVMAQPEAWRGKRLQVHGHVVKDSIRRKGQTQEYRFLVENGGHTIEARFTGFPPDTFFKPEAEVVMKGRLEGNVFLVQPDGIMAKCPSKYEASKGGGARAGR